MSSNGSASPLLESAKAYLQKSDENGSSLYEHLVELVTAAQHKHMAIEKIGNESLRVRTSSHRSNVHGLRQESRFQTVSKETLENSIRLQTLLKEDSPGSRPRKVQNLVGDALRFRMAGCPVLSETEAEQIAQVMLGMSQRYSVADTRFWGKLGPYFVIEMDHVGATPQNAFKDAQFLRDKKGRPLPDEEPGFGLNAYSYAVSLSPTGAFEFLPETTAAQVVASKRIRKLLTGNLNAAIRSYPPFPGGEKELLRALVARISAAAFVAPKGAFSEKVFPDPPEEEDENAPPVVIDKSGPAVIRSAEFEPLEDPADTGSWVHVLPRILKSGRATNPPKPAPPVASGDEDEGAAEEEEEPDDETYMEEEKAALAGTLSGDDGDSVLGQIKKRVLAPVVAIGKGDADGEDGGGDDDDAPVAIPAWVARTTNSSVAASKVAIVRSVRWPGAVAYAAKGGAEYACVYVGNGLRMVEESTFSLAGFAPAALPPMVGDRISLLQTIETEAKLSGTEQLGSEAAPGADEEEPDE